ncbi:hypothetical protein TIFTF001_012063 [Ficus carica]|uniref:Uncharacterized protein n=1 Tax=Ficus carica TaxID=3494 RepID=A0AA88ABM3_FICCA|nr:hypothetical protein TIFTF001_012063 [Ficus carica]
MKCSSPLFKSPASHYEALSNDSVSWKPRTIAEALARAQGLIENADQFCKFHRDHGYLTVDCKVLHYEIVEFLKRGHLKEFLSYKGHQTYGISKDRFECDKRRSNETPSPPPTKKTIRVILGGSMCSGDSGSLIRKHIKKASIPPPNYLPSDP